MAPGLNTPRPNTPGPVLVMGFGPFLSVSDNPSSKLAREVHGVALPGGIHIVGEEMPVSYQRGADLAWQRARELDASMVLGVGVAMDRKEVTVERYGRRCSSGTRPDVDGQPWDEDPELPLGPAQVTASLDVDALARAMDARVSEDAGQYVCNAWLYLVTCRLGGRLPVGFVHLPPDGMSAARLLRGLRAVLASPPLLG